VLNDSAILVVVNVVNRHEANAITADIILQSGDFAGSARVDEVIGKIPDQGNPRAQEPVNTVTSNIKFKGNTVKYSFPAHSVTQLRIALK
jgi:alpha-N-arabinofuranosidase